MHPGLNSSSGPSASVQINRTFGSESFEILYINPDVVVLSYFHTFLSVLASLRLNFEFAASKVLIGT